MAKDLGKNLDIWKDRTLFDVTEESNLSIIASPHQKKERETQRESEKHNEHKNMLKTVTLLNVNNGSSGRGRPN